MAQGANSGGLLFFVLLIIGVVIGANNLSKYLNKLPEDSKFNVFFTKRNCEIILFSICGLFVLSFLLKSLFLVAASIVLFFAFTVVATRTGKLELFDPKVKERKEQERLAKIEREKELELDRQIHKPKCPTCGSENVGPIGELEKALDFSGFGTIAGGGLKSKSLGKSYQCYNCKYMW